MDVLYAPATGDEFRGKPVQQFRMTGGLTAQAKVIRRIHQSSPEKFLPHSIHDDPSCQRMVCTHQPPREVQSIHRSVIVRRSDGIVSGTCYAISG